MKKLFPVFAFVGASLLAGCGEEGISFKKDVVNDMRPVSWFMEAANKDAMIEVLRFCKDNPGVKKSIPNCTNADKASRDLCWNERSEHAEEIEKLREEFHESKLGREELDKRANEWHKKLTPSCLSRSEFDSGGPFSILFLDGSY